MQATENPGVIEVPSTARRADAPTQPSAALATSARAGARTSGFQRAKKALNSALPLIERLLPLLDGNIASAALNLVAPRTDSRAVHIDLGPIERGLADVQARQQKIASQLAAQSLPLDQLRTQFVPELQRQVEELKSASLLAARNQERILAAQDKIHRKFNRFALVTVLLLAAIFLANLIWLYMQRPFPH